MRKADPPKRTRWHATYWEDDSLSNPDPIAVELNAARKAAGFEFLGTLARLAVNPPQRTIVNTTNVPPDFVTDPSLIPSRDTWYADPAQVFDNLYFVGSRIHSSWALTTSEGIILFDTLFPYNSEELIIGGLESLGLDPDDIVYAIISHAHRDHIGGAEMLQQRGAQIVMGAKDWDLVETYPARYRTMAPSRDISVHDDLELSLGDTTVHILNTPGHTPGTLGYVFTVLNKGEPVSVAYPGGTAMSFIATTDNYQQYIDSQRKLAALAASANSTVLLSNHSEFDSATTKLRLLQGLQADETNPFVLGEAWVQRYFEVTARCARAAQLRIDDSGKELAAI